MKLGSKIRGLFALVVGFAALAGAIAISAADDPAPANPAPANPPATPPPAKPMPKPVAADFRVDRPAAQVAAIHAALAKESKVDFETTSLPDAFEFLSDLHGVRILIDSRVVPEETQTASVTLKMSDVPLSAVLDRLLDSQKLDWVIRDNVLLVTTPRRAANLLETHYYDLTKLGRVDGTPADIVDLIGQLQEDRVPDELNAQEQVPEATKKVLNQNNLLIVRDNRRGHEMIEKLLAAMAASAPEEPATVVMPIPRVPGPMTIPHGIIPPRLPMLPGPAIPPKEPAPAPKIPEAKPE